MPAEVAEAVGGLKELTPSGTSVLLEGELAETPPGTKQVHKHCPVQRQSLDVVQVQGSPTASRILALLPLRMPACTCSHTLHDGWCASCMRMFLWVPYNISSEMQPDGSPGNFCAACGAEGEPGGACGHM